MRQFGNESDESGNPHGEFNAAINPRPSNVIYAADIVAAADATCPGALLDPQADDAPLIDLASDLPPLPPSIADWLPTFRPFASSPFLIDEAAGTSAAISPSSSVEEGPPVEVDATAHSYNLPITHIIGSSSAGALDVMTAETASQNSLQKLYEHLSALDRDPFDHDHAVDAGFHEPVRAPVVVPDDNGAHTTAQIVESGGGHSSTGGTSTISTTDSDMVWTLVGDDAGSTTTTTGTSTGTSTTTAGGAASAGLIINVNYDASVNSAPAAFKADVAAAVSYLQSQFSDPITITISVGYGEVNGQTMGGGALGQSMYYVASFNYSQVKNALVADAKTADDLSSIATLPTVDPTNGGTYYVASAEAKALGLWAGTIPDGWIGLSSGAAWDYNNADGVSAGTYDFYGTVLHEISEVLGRETTDGLSATYNPLDLFHYSAPGVRTFSGTTPGYFSVNNGQTNLNSFNTNPGGDFGDWAGNTPDAGNAYGTPGVVSPFSAADLTALDVIGWNRVSSGAPAVPTISSVSPDTGVAGDGITNASTLTLTGTAVASSTVNVYDGATLLGTATANASGAWTFTSGTLGNGAHSFTATDTVSGVTSGASSALSMTVDTVAPTAPSIATEAVVNTNQIALTGAAEANSTVKIYDGATLLGSVTASASRAWSFTTAALSTGTHNLTETATDVAGNTSAASSVLAVAVNPSASVIESIGSTSLVNVGNHFYLDNISTGSGPSLKYGGADVVAGQFGGGWAPIGAEQTATGYEVAWKNTAGQYSLWTTDSSGNFISTTQPVSGTSSTIENAETRFHQDLNGDGAIGVPGTLIEASGSTSLVEVGTKFFLDSISTGSGPSLKYGGADVVAGQFGSGWAPIGAEQTATGYEVAWKNTAGQYSLWTTDSSGNFISTTQPMSGTSSTIENAETRFHQDLNGDGAIGVPGTLIEASGSTSLVEVGTKFFLDSISTGSGPSLKYGGADVVAGQFGGGWAPIGAEQTATGYEVAWKNTAGQYSLWTTDSSGNFISTTQAMSGTSSTIENAETRFHQDLNGDGAIGVPGTLIEASGSSSLVEVGTKFFLDSISTGSGPSLKYGGADVVAGQFGSGWAPIGAEQTATGYEVAWKNTAGQYSLWTTDSSGNFISTTQRCRARVAQSKMPKRVSIKT